MFKNEEGFSLLELVVAVGVAGIIAAVALPTFAGIQDKATTTSATYAASASAAEALANSTIGNTGGNGSASTTGGASSSAAASSNTGVTISGNLINSLNYPHRLSLVNVASSGGGTGPANGEFAIQTGQELAQFSAISAAAANNGLAGRTITFSNVNGMFFNGSNASVEGRSFTIVSSSYNYVNLNGMDWGYVTSVKWTYSGNQFETSFVTGNWTIN